MTDMKAGLPIREYNRIHQWVGRNFKKTGKCAFCKVKAKTHWSNENHRYRLDRVDWVELCPKCHVHYDVIVLKSKHGKPRQRVSRLFLTELKQEVEGSGIKWDSLKEVEKRIKTYRWYSE